MVKKNVNCKGLPFYAEELTPEDVRFRQEYLGAPRDRLKGCYAFPPTPQMVKSLLVATKQKYKKKNEPFVRVGTENTF